MLFIGLILGFILGILLMGLFSSSAYNKGWSDSVIHSRLNAIKSQK